MSTAITGKVYEVHKELTLITALILTLNTKTPKETNSVQEAGIILTTKIAKNHEKTISHMNIDASIFKSLANCIL